MNCHTAVAPTPEGAADESLVILAGQPNVGKSVIFKRLTGRYVTVSNYPGTTVEVAQGTARMGHRRVTLVDAPGINSLQPLAADEEVTRALLLRREAQSVVQVADAKNLSRALFLTLQFAELDFPLVLDLNMADEAQLRGVKIETVRLGELLGIDVVSTVATSGQGIGDLAHSMSAPRVPSLRVGYSREIEEGVAAVVDMLSEGMPGKRWMALALLAKDAGLEKGLRLSLEETAALEGIRARASANLPRSLAQTITQQRWGAVAALVDAVYVQNRAGGLSWGERLARWAVHPVLGWPILLVVMFALYKFVGEFGAGTLVGLFEGTLFEEWINPWITGVMQGAPVPALVADFLVGEYGLLTVGLAYGIGIVLPIVTTFFLAFGVLEDLGYLPRLAVLLNRSFKRIGLNGKAILPMALGLGCVTMATMTTRILRYEEGAGAGDAAAGAERAVLGATGRDAGDGGVA